VPLAASPSIVVTFLAPSALIATEQERVAIPSMWTVQAPHWAMPQPYLVPVSVVAGKQITTIEGLAVNGVLSKVQKAWLDLDVPQCGYCQSGMIMAVSALLKEKPKPTDAEIDAAITNICRCGTYQQVRAAIHAAAASA